MKRFIMLLVLVTLSTILYAAVTKVYYARVPNSVIEAMGGIKFSNSTGVTITIGGSNDATYHYFYIVVTGANAAELGQFYNNDVLPYIGDYLEFVEVTKSSAQYIKYIATPTP